MLMLMLLQGADRNAAGALRAVEDMNNALPQYVIDHAIAAAIFDSLFVGGFLIIISILRALLGRRRAGA
jgi:hypothetical protein